MKRTEAETCWTTLVTSIISGWLEHRLIFEEGRKWQHTHTHTHRTKLIWGGVAEKNRVDRGGGESYGRHPHQQDTTIPLQQSNFWQLKPPVVMPQIMIQQCGNGLVHWCLSVCVCVSAMCVMKGRLGVGGSKDGRDIEFACTDCRACRRAPQQPS